MRITLLLVCLVLGAGCKRGAKTTGPARDDLANAKVQPAPATSAPERKDDKKDEPNWLKDPRVQPKRDQLPVDGPASSGKQPWVAGAVDVGAPPAAKANPGAPAQPAAGAMPVQPVPGANPPALAPAGNTPRGAAARVVAMADMRDLQIFIDNASGATGRMPSGAEIMAALIEAKSPVAGLVKDGAVILTGAKQRESVWAYESRAYLSGGLVVSQNGVERLTAEELKARLGK